jgi:hypothetical protein
MVLIFVFNCSLASAAEPTLRNLNLRGLQIGGTTALTVDGDDLGTAPKLLLPFAAQQELQPGGTDKQVKFNVSLAADVTPGYYQARIVTDQGVSLPMLIAVDKLPQRAFASAVESLPSAQHGNIGGSQVLETKFTGKKDEPVIVEVEAQRLGGKLRPVIHLYDAKHKQLAWAWATPQLGGDARLTALLPADGEYIAALHDVEYSVPRPGQFRLRIGRWDYVDQVFPAKVAVGQATGVELLGSGKFAVNVPGSTTLGALALAWPGDALFSGPRPFVEISPQPQLLEQPGQVFDLPEGLAEVSGRLLAPLEEDRYRVKVIPNTKLRCEVFAERSRSPVDVALVIRNEKGDQLARGEDSPETLDPVLEYNVPADAQSVIVGVVDAQGRGGRNAVYRLVVDGRLAGSVSNDFELQTPAQRVTLPVGGRCVVPIHAERRGYNGEISLIDVPLAAGMRLENAKIMPDCDGTLVSVVRGELPQTATVFSWQGKGADGLVRTATIQNHPLTRLQPWLASEVALATSTAKAEDFTIEYGEIPADAALLATTKLTLPLKIKRPDNPAFEKATTRVTLLTSQLPVLQNRQVDTNKMLRLEKQIELAANVLQGEAIIQAPSELPSAAYDLCLVAELLGPDKQRPLATAFAPVKRLNVKQHLVVQLAEPKIEVQLDAKAGGMAKINGKIERLEGLTGDVQITLTGLPNGARADQVNVKADQTDFAVNVAIPPNACTGEWLSLKISASGTPDPKQGQRVKSREVPVTLVIKAAP